MNYLIQHGRIRSQVINVPEGLPELLSDITREVLRCQPNTECLCQFIIDYLHSVIVARDKARMAKMAIDRALRKVDDVIADMCICDIPKTKAEKMSAAMEECFKRFLAQRRCERGRNIEMIKFNEVDMLDELIEKCKFSEEEIKISRPVIETAYQKFVDAYMQANENSEGPEILYQYFRDREQKRLEEQTRQEAALKIQATFRGFLVRRSLFLNKDVEKPVEEISETNDDLLEQEKAARKIQRFFRRHMSIIRKDNDVPSPQPYEFQDVCSPESKISLVVQTTSIHDLDQLSQANSVHNEDIADTVVEPQPNGNREQQNLQELPVEVEAEFEPKEINISLKQSLESIRKSKLGSTIIDPETDEQLLEEEEELVHE